MGSVTMSSGMLVSIIVPIFNVAPYLDEALDSVVSQTYRDLEVIVVDDGSTDGSGEMCEAWVSRDPRVKVVHQPNGGLSRARNVGLDLASGDAVAFLDSDDAWLPDFVERMAAGMEGSRADVVACRYAMLHEGEWAGLLTRPPEPRLASGTYSRDGALRALASGGLDNHVWDKLYRRSLWDGVRFPEGRVYEDVATTYRVLDRCGGLLMLDDALCLYRGQRPGGITATRSLPNALDAALAYSELASFVASRPEMFSDGQADGLRALCLNALLIVCLYATDGGGDAWQEVADDLRILALDAGTPEVLAACGVRTRVAWRLLRYCPGLFAAAYLPYRALRDLGRALVGR